MRGRVSQVVLEEYRISQESKVPFLFLIFGAISAAFRIHGERLGHAFVTSFVLVPPSTRNRMHAPIWHAGHAGNMPHSDKASEIRVRYNYK